MKAHIPTKKKKFGLAESGRVPNLLIHCFNLCESVSGGADSF